MRWILLLVLHGRWCAASISFHIHIPFHLILFSSYWLSLVETEAPEILPLLFDHDIGHVVFALSIGVSATLLFTLYSIVITKCKSMMLDDLKTATLNQTLHKWLSQWVSDAVQWLLLRLTLLVQTNVVLISFVLVFCVWGFPLLWLY